MRAFCLIVPLLSLSSGVAVAAPSPAEEIHPDIVLFFQAASSDEKIAEAALDEIEKHWRDGYTPMFIDFARLMRAPVRARSGAAGGGGSLVPETMADAREGHIPTDLSARSAAAAGERGSPVRRRLLQFLKKRTGQKFGEDLDGWRRWMWSLPYDPHPDYAFFKAGVYRNIDPRMTEFLYPERAASIRLDEIDWGGVKINGIVPLDQPAVVAAEQAGFMADADVVFGVEIDGESRAYPKRIVAWHEVVRDKLGATDVALIYCTMCGSVIPYESRIGNEKLTLGTSGLLYRSNKLMFDEQTMTLWSSIYGKPVVGPRVGSGQRLKRFPVATTTWGEWKSMHPDTTVLTTDTGFDRDYSENAAYGDYEKTDRIMFEIPKQDKRLKNKQVVITLEHRGQALAVARKFLLDNPIYHHSINGDRIAFVTSRGGTTRAYLVGDREFANWGEGMSLVDAREASWRVEEDAIVGDDGTLLPRVATSPSYWFGWHAQYPDTELVK